MRRRIWPCHILGQNLPDTRNNKRKVDSRAKEFREVEGINRWMPDDVAHCRPMKGVLILC